MLFPEISTKATESLTATGYTYVSALYSLKQTTFNETQVVNFGLSYTNKTYYVTCWAVEYDLAESRNIVRRKVEYENIGIDPDNLDQRGFSITQTVPGVIQTFTTYIWAIAETNTNYSYIEYLPRYYNGSNYVLMHDEYDWAKKMTWNYYAY